MITELSTVKARLGIDEFEVKYDALLTRAIKAFGKRFEKICRRKFQRTVNVQQEYFGRDVEIILTQYPLESVLKFETKEIETDPWVEKTGVEYLVQQGCVIRLNKRLADCGAGRVTYTGGYVMPGDTVGAGQTALPEDLENAAVEQVAAWFQNRDKLGRIRIWPKGGVYEEFQQSELLPGVAAVLRAYRRLDL
jgi:hypothetical protein